MSKEIFQQTLFQLFFERKRSNPMIMYHGTSSKFLSKIFQMGIVPNPDKGKWKNVDLGKDVSISKPSLQSLEGSYWTDNIGVASSAANNATKSQGGEKMFVLAQLMLQNAVADEDDIRPAVLSAFREAYSSIYGNMDFEMAAPHLLALIENDIKAYIKLVKDFAELLHDKLKNDEQPFEQDFFRPIFDATLERILGHLDFSQGRTRDYYFRELEYQLEQNFDGDFEKARKIVKNKIVNKDFPSFDKNEGENNFLKALDKIARRYRKTAKPQKKKWGLRTNLRMMEPVGFKGRNKIVAILVGDDKNFTLAYGNLPKKFVNDWSRHWGPYFKVYDPKTKKIIYNGNSN